MILSIMLSPNQKILFFGCSMRVLKARTTEHVEVVYFFVRLEYDSPRNLDSTPKLAADHFLWSLKSLMANQRRLKEKSTTSRFVVLNESKALMACMKKADILRCDR